MRPNWPGMSRFHGPVIHSSEYRNGAPWKGRAVLVVGFGNSACEQALDLVEDGAQAHISVRSPVNVVPRDVFGVLSGRTARHPSCVACRRRWQMPWPSR